MPVQELIAAGSRLIAALLVVVGNVDDYCRVLAGLQAAGRSLLQHAAWPDDDDTLQAPRAMCLVAVSALGKEDGLTLHG